MRFGALFTLWLRRIRAQALFVGIVLFVSACGGTPQAETFILHIYDDTPTPLVAVGQGVPLLATGNPAEPVTRNASAPIIGDAQSCPLLSLPRNQHISSSGSYSMTETEAAGPMVCRIERNSCAYGLLVMDWDPDIGFSTHKPAPLTNEDRQMHPAMVTPLDRLSRLVQQEWRGTENLYVSAAYDSTGEHDLNQPNPALKYSLHFEGRSADLILSPWDPAKLDRLCALAYCAGFDWTQNEGDHCHVSVKAQSLCSFCSGSVPTAIPSYTPVSTPARH